MNWTPQGPTQPYPESERYDSLLASISDPYDDTQPWVQQAQSKFFCRNPDRCTPQELELMGTCYPYWTLLIFKDTDSSKTQLQAFLKNNATQLTRHELKTYRAANDEQFQLAQVGSYDGGYLPLTDLFSHEVLEVRERNPGPALPSGTILLSHLRRLSTHSEFNCAVPVPESQKEHLLAGMESYLTLLRDEMPKAQMSHVFRDMFPEVLQLALSCIRQA